MFAPYRDQTETHLLLCYRIRGLFPESDRLAHLDCVLARPVPDNSPHGTKSISIEM